MDIKQIFQKMTADEKPKEDGTNKRKSVAAAADPDELKRKEEEKERLRLQREEEKRKKEEERLQRLEEAKRKEEEKERLRLQREEEKRKKEEEREKLKREKEEELKRKEEERERLKKEKEEELKRREEEKERLRLQREEEKRKKDEEKEKQRIERLEKEKKRLEALNAKLEEKKKKEEEKQQAEDAKREVEEKKKQQFFSYFIKKEVSASSSQASVIHDDEKNCRFLPFQLKANMYLPPIHRRINYNEEKESIIRNLDKLMEKQSNEKNYLTELKNGVVVPRTYPNTIELNEIIAIDTSQVNKFKVKLLLFDPKEYRRPPYYGTWRKKSNCIKPRRPFAKDTDTFDYEVDSDEEWEDEPDGESIASSKCDDEDEMLDDDDEDDGFFVPHGHLSDDEIDEENRIPEKDLKEDIERVKREQWENEQRKKNSNVIIPKFAGCVWESETIEELKKYKIVPLFDLPIAFSNHKKEDEKVDDETRTTPTKPTKASKTQKPTTDVVESSPANPKKSKHVTTPSQKQATTPSQNKLSNSTQSITKFISRKKETQIAAVPLAETSMDALITTPKTPQQSIPEKRGHTDGDSSCVKRLKLDTIDDATVVKDQNDKENDEDMACIVLE